MDAARVMCAGGVVWKAAVAGELVAVAGLYDLGRGEAELWASFTPDASKNMAGIFRKARLTLSRTSYLRILTCCNSRAGSRMAKLLGFVFLEQTELGELWIWKV